MEAVIEQIPQTGEIQLTIQITARFNYSAAAAQGLVRRFVADEISYLLRVGEPALVTAERIVWRVPVLLAYPGSGRVGQVGTVDVDVEDGRILLSSEQIEAIRSTALEIPSHYIAPSSASQTNRLGVSK